MSDTQDQAPDSETKAPELSEFELDEVSGGITSHVTPDLVVNEHGPEFAGIGYA